MTISTAFTTDFLTRCLTGDHDWENDTFKVALYTSSADLDADTTAYSTTNEVSGSGYVAGGATLSAASGYPQIVSGKMAMQFDDASWAASTITARGALIYNSSQSNAAVMAIDFGRDISSTAATFALKFSLMSRPLIEVG
jgi:hypothetical protein